MSIREAVLNDEELDQVSGGILVNANADNTSKIIQEFEKEWLKRGFDKDEEVTRTQKDFLKDIYIESGMSASEFLANI
ncbi:MAG: bacteriocin [Lachnospiraceae bacterium]|nr:bacteriocin [Lachnospiraceae bacterium]